jgi:glutamyl-tRNA reductase
MKFDPSTMPDTISPIVKALRIMVETTIDDELEKIEKKYDQETVNIVEKSLRAVTMKIFHNNPNVHMAVKENINEFDKSIAQLFGIEV